MRTTAAIVLASLVLAGCQRGDRVEAPEARRTSQMLFNGRNLDGWEVWLGANEGADETFTVRDGLIHCTGTPAGYIQTENEHESFVLEVEWRWAAQPGNSGVLLRKGEGDKLWPRSFEAQLMHGNAGDIILIDGFGGELERRQGNFGRKSDDAENPAGEWNRYRIVLDGPEAELFVNGQRVNGASGVEVLPGRICLQSEGAPIQFRNIRVTPLD